MNAHDAQHAQHEQFADWDAAFVLGALSPSDRRSFEAHLQECEKCRAAIVHLAPTIALLARITPDRAESLLEVSGLEEGPDVTRRRELVSIGVQEAKRRRRTWWAAGLAAAAAIVVAVVLAVTVAIGPSLRGVQVIALEPVVDIPITATVELVDVAWGTRLEMICSYPDGEDHEEDAAGWPYALYVTGTDGTTSEVSSWVALPGKTARLGAGTALDPDEIASIEIRSLTSGRVLMRSELQQPDAAAG
jgi:hypothetical protein